MNTIRSFYTPTVVTCLSACMTEKIWRLELVPENPNPRNDAEIEANLYTRLMTTVFAGLSLKNEYTSICNNSAVALLQGRVKQLTLHTCYAAASITAYTGIGFNILFEGLHLALIAGTFAVNKNTNYAVTRVAVWSCLKTSPHLPIGVQKFISKVLTVVTALHVFKNALDYFDKKEYYTLVFYTTFMSFIYLGGMEKLAVYLKKKKQEEALRATRRQ